MPAESRESVQIINTAIIKTKEKQIDSSYEYRLAEICNSPAVTSLSLAITNLAETEDISQDQAAIRIIETVEELSGIWKDYIAMEGISKLKELLKGSPQKIN